jgi:hypothetical protein
VGDDLGVGLALEHIAARLAAPRAVHHGFR